jgi:hypothetical protein
VLIPKTGLYEQLIDVMLDGRLRELPDSAYEIQREKVDEAEAHAVLSRYLQKVIRNALRSLPARNRLENQITLANRIIALIGEITGDATLDGAALPFRHPALRLPACGLIRRSLREDCRRRGVQGYKYRSSVPLFYQFH